MATPTFQRRPQLTINPFHRDSFKSDSYVFRLRGGDDPGDFYRQKTVELQDIVADHLAAGTALRGIGSSWSLTDVGVTPGSLVTTETWTQVFDLGQAAASAYAGSDQDRRGLCLVEAGTNMANLDGYLLGRGLSVKAHGANNGQSLVGASSTNTHGAAYRFGAMHDAIVGIHLVAGPDESLYLERASHPVLDPGWVGGTLQARLVADDDLFNAAVVSFGSMGVIRGVVLETRPLFTLEARAFTHHYDGDLRAAMTSYDFGGVEVDIAQNLTVPAWQNGRELYHFEIIFNPNDPANDAPGGHNVAHLNLMVADPDLGGWVAPPTEPADLQPGGAEIMARVLAALGPLGNFARGMINDEIARHVPDGTLRAPMRYLFRGQVPQPRAFASGVALPAERSADAFDIALSVYRGLNKTLPVIVSGRYVKGTPATLGFTRFANTCVLEIDGIRGVGVEDYLRRVLGELETADIPFALHWGKAIDWYDQPGKIEQAFDEAGTGTVTRWKSAREQLLPTSALRQVFTNDFLTRVGLAAQPPVALRELVAPAPRAARARKKPTKARALKKPAGKKTRALKTSPAKSAKASAAIKRGVKKPPAGKPTTRRGTASPRSSKGTRSSSSKGRRA